MVRKRKQVKHSTFSLGKFGYIINGICIGWIALAIVLFCMPYSLPVQAATMNYASVVSAGFAVVSVAWYFIHGKKNFTGPPVPKDADPTIAGEIPEDGKESVPTDTESQTISKTQWRLE